VPAYDLKKLRGKQLVRRMGKTARYEPSPTGLRAIAALLVLRDQAIKPLLTAAQQIRPTHRPQNPRPLDIHYQTIYAGMKGVFQELGITCMKSDNYWKQSKKPVLARHSRPRNLIR
jgi:hypothetical protein